MTAQEMRFRVLGEAQEILSKDPHLVVAGYTARDPAVARRHIDELAAIGVPPPATVPAYYPLVCDLATHQADLSVAGHSTSGEVEPVLLRAGGRLYLGVGSDHTDRELEKTSVARSKAVCPKPISDVVVAIPDDGLDWAAITVRSSVDGEPYQEGSLETLIPPPDLLARYLETASPVSGDVILFGGTVPLLYGQFVPGTDWTVAMSVPGYGVLERSYRIQIRA
jgi:hypothetical protein